MPSPSAPVRAASFQPLEIVTKNGVQVFSVEMATTEEEKQTGLMYRKELADGKGMLFDFSPEQEVSMWMKNTYISLDMIFIRADGRILRIAENTEPHVDQDHLVPGASPGACWRWWRERRRNTVSGPATASAIRCSAANGASRRAAEVPSCWPGSWKRVSTGLAGHSGYSAAW